MRIEYVEPPWPGPFVELWCLQTSNLLADFDTEAKALDFLRPLLHEHGEDYIAGFGINTVIDEDGNGDVIAYGEALVDLIRASEAGPSDSTR